MMDAEDAEKMAEHCKANPLKLNGKRLTVYVSRKYRQLKHGSVSAGPLAFLAFFKHSQTIDKTLGDIRGKGRGLVKRQ